MRNNLILSFVLFSTLFGAGTPLPAEEERLNGPIRATLIRVIDGDTIAVKAQIWVKQEVQTLVRLRGIDTPEKRGHCQRERELAKQAQDQLEHMLGNNPVYLHEIGQDKYGGRVVARIVTQSGLDVAEKLTAAGLAYAYQGGHKQSWCPGGEDNPPGEDGG